MTQLLITFINGRYPSWWSNFNKSWWAVLKSSPTNDRLITEARDAELLNFGARLAVDGAQWHGGARIVFDSEEDATLFLLRYS